MRAVVQRVKKSSVTVEEKITGKIGQGLMVLIGVEDGDSEKDADYIADKVCGLRIFEDEQGKMNLSVEDIGGEVLAVSQFTLLADARKGRRPSFTKAAAPDEANALYRKVIDKIESRNINVEEGVFQAEMMVEIHNDGPVTILLDSNKMF
ncbi:MAG: D-tyrosyl-tRNA(Tyr) deacylase [Firmicutes bacterium]|nr:D-tyrosyl-tRNA(Tyr) deacylase [Bacillota bacterium]MBR2619205.1 D-tyrosyl-tRNA(Tyr) deacylase [Bacillota bacterium]MBR6798548.1 D-tyrosyl-tRNA(Tyr) deacylase [Bacillota bacterium]